MSVLDAFSLSGKAALVTGGNRGIGFALTQGPAEAGARVAFVSRDDEQNRKAHKISPIWDSTRSDCVGTSLLTQLRWSMRPSTGSAVWTLW
jgi:NAD(P)-dependent dehydrogenase (short-subunit alcohol dehydrogenase family)